MSVNIILCVRRTTHQNSPFVVDVHRNYVVTMYNTRISFSFIYIHAPEIIIGSNKCAMIDKSLTVKKKKEK